MSGWELGLACERVLVTLQGCFRLEGDAHASRWPVALHFSLRPIPLVRPIQDAAQNLPRAKLYYAVMRLTSEEELKHAEMGGAEVFGNASMAWEADPPPTGKAPKWNDGLKKIHNHAASNTSALIVEIYSFGEKGSLCCCLRPTRFRSRGLCWTAQSVHVHF